MNQDRPLTVGILIFNDVEVLDFCGPSEVFSVARPAGEYGDEFKLFNVVTIAESVQAPSSLLNAACLITIALQRTGVVSSGCAARIPP